MGHRTNYVKGYICPCQCYRLCPRIGPSGALGTVVMFTSVSAWLHYQSEYLHCELCMSFHQKRVYIYKWPISFCHIYLYTSDLGTQVKTSDLWICNPLIPYSCTSHTQLDMLIRPDKSNTELDKFILYLSRVEMVTVARCYMSHCVWMGHFHVLISCMIMGDIPI